MPDDILLKLAQQLGGLGAVLFVFYRILYAIVNIFSNDSETREYIAKKDLNAQITNSEVIRELNNSLAQATTREYRLRERQYKMGKAMRQMSDMIGELQREIRKLKKLKDCEDVRKENIQLRRHVNTYTRQGN